LFSSTYLFSSAFESKRRYNVFDMYTPIELSRSQVAAIDLNRHGGSGNRLYLKKSRSRALFRNL